MNKSNQVLMITSVLLLTLTITACQKQTSVPATATPTENQQVTDNKPAENVESSSDTTTSSMVTCESTKSFDMGMNDKRTATLKKSNDYSLYVFDGYTLDTKNNRLELTKNPKYYAEIEKLPSDFKLDELRNQAMQELKAYGEVKEYKGDQLYEGPMVDASLVLQVSNEKSLYEYVIWEDKQSKDSYIFRVQNPVDTTSVNFLTPALTSLSTINSNPDH